ncbi:hypothetical protein BP5796_09630 [Coleophoma crateriformis]|uniref:Uncharacterized protein n=1 Tax=Coleophoma crateriformis TaxID=565419 RepID=A0A3D8QYY6_9HELO|nr:hypothetical protein BP5796_09630 [Coleophoma crateriformis]
MGPLHSRRTKLRTITILVSLTTLITNILSLLLCYQFQIPTNSTTPWEERGGDSDGGEYGRAIARHFAFYLHFANVLSVFGVFGAVVEHALSVAIFSNYLLLDTILCSIPRFLLLFVLHNVSSTLCLAPSNPDTSTPPSAPHNTHVYQSPRSAAVTDPLISQSMFTPSLGGSWAPSSSSTWNESSCSRVLLLVQLTMVAAVVAGTLLQFVGALQVREFARCLWREDWKSVDAEEIVGIVVVGDRVPYVAQSQSGLPVIFEDAEEENWERKA